MSTEFLLEMDFWLWVADTFVFLGILLVSIKKEWVYSTTLVLAVVFAYGGVTHRIAEFLLQHNHGDYRSLVLMVWYLGFSVGYWLSIKLIKTLHIKFRVELQPLARMYVVAYMVIMNIILFTYADDLTFKTGWFDSIYGIGIPLINAGSTTIAAIIVSIACWHHFRKTKTRFRLCQI